MLRSHTLKVAGLLLVAAFLLVSLTATVMAGGPTKNGKPVTHQQDAKPVEANAGGVVAIIVVGGAVLLVFANGSTKRVDSSNGGVTRSDIARACEEEDDR